jgi:hypothetical protein
MSTRAFGPTLVLNVARTSLPLYVVVSGVHRQYYGERR